MPNVKFWLLDINDVLIDGAPVIRLWGIDDAGRRVVIYDRNFSPSFFLLVNPSEDPAPILEEIRRLSREYGGILDIGLERRRYFGRERDVVRVVFKDNNSLTKGAEVLSKAKGVEAVLEDDIRFSMKYMIDGDVQPCSWHEVEAREGPIESGVQIDRAYEAVSSPRAESQGERPSLGSLAFSILCPGSRGSPRPSTDPVRGIFVKSGSGEERVFLAEGEDDSSAIESFSELIKEEDPDLIVGFGSTRFDWPYLMERAKLKGIPLRVGRGGELPHRSVYGHISITGRANLDLLNLMDDIPEVKQKALSGLAEFLGVVERGEIMDPDEVELAREWRSAEGRERLREHFAKRTDVLMKCYEALLDFATALSNITGLPLDQAAAAAVGFRVDSIMMRGARMIGEIIPKRKERPHVAYKGGMVLQPKPGLHENIVVLDFKSMYPNLMMFYNISPDTYCPPGEDCGDVFEIPEVGHRFRKDKEGLYRVVLSKLMREREKIKGELRGIPRGDPSYKALAERERAVKVLLNACYGYSGWTGARWYSKEVAESAAALGRATIKRAIEVAMELGLEPIYGDTDSIFLKNDAKIEGYVRKVMRETGVEIKIDKVYKRILFMESKKRYAGLLENGDLDVVGLEAVRGDWSGVSKVMQEGMLRAVLSGKGPNGAVEFARYYISEVRSKAVPFRDFIIWKTLTKPVEEYEVKAPHVEAAKRLLADGIGLNPGDEVGYVIIKGSGKIHERARPYSYATIEDVDIEYYINNQLIPVASRILSIFGIAGERVLGTNAEGLKGFSASPSLSERPPTSSSP
ncbi:MAG: DNA-directed DNA polymerase [Candidatus Bathyarchaeia archaeon]